MIARETVHEVEAFAALAVDVPSERGGEVRAAAADRIEDVGAVRAAGVETTGDVEAGEAGLRVNVEADLTLHFDTGGAAEHPRSALADAECVLEVYAFERRAGPYEIEAW